jgi:hypothetical protein
MTQLIVMYKQVIFSYYKAGLGAFWNYFWLYDTAHRDV